MPMLEMRRHGAGRPATARMRACGHRTRLPRRRTTGAQPHACAARARGRAPLVHACMRGAPRPELLSPAVLNQKATGTPCPPPTPTAPPLPPRMNSRGSAGAAGLPSGGRRGSAGFNRESGSSMVGVGASGVRARACACAVGLRGHWQRAWRSRVRMSRCWYNSITAAPNRWCATSQHCVRACADACRAAAPAPTLSPKRGSSRAQPGGPTPAKAC